MRLKRKKSYCFIRNLVHSHSCDEWFTPRRERAFILSACISCVLVCYFSNGYRCIHPDDSRFSLIWLCMSKTAFQDNNCLPRNDNRWRWYQPCVLSLKPPSKVDTVHMQIFHVAWCMDQFLNTNIIISGDPVHLLP